MGLDEYYDYGVWRPEAREARMAFVGWRAAWKLQEAMSSPGWSVQSSDKLVCASLCRAWDLAHPQLRAIYSEGQARAGGDVPTLRSLDEARAFLASPEARLPLFVKPIRSRTGIGGAAVAGFDAATDRAILANGGTAALREVFAPNAGDRGYWPAGCLLQELLRPHPEIARRTGGRLCTARVIVLLEREGPRVTQAWLRVARGANMVDNIRHGETGNSWGAVEVATGRVLRQVVDAGFDETEIQRHPDTGEPIVGFVLPDWEAGLALCLRASLCFGGFRAQGWDLALTDRGPVLVELNAPFDLDAAQIAAQRGFRDAAVDRILAEVQQRG